MLAALTLWMLAACRSDDATGCLEGSPPSDTPSSETLDGTGLSGSTATGDTGGVRGTELLSGSTGDTSARRPSTASTGTTGATGPTADTFDTALLVPLIGDALASRCDPFATLPTGSGGDELHRATLVEGRCNDGTPAVAYVRAATDPALEGTVVVHLDGGNRCATGEECSIRWCGEDFYDARKMSSAWELEARDVTGLSSTDARNALAGAHHVQLPYCTSDNWVGTRSNVVLTNDDGVKLRVHYEGTRVFEGVLDALDAGLASDDGAQSLPALSGAERLILAGSSAGAVGVMAHLDRTAERYPSLEVVGLLDAMSGPSDAHLDPKQLALAHDLAQHQYDTEFRDTFGAVLDDSCLAATDPWVCATPTAVQFDYLDTPYFMHFDLRDPLISDRFQTFAMTAAEFTDATAATLLDLSVARPEVGVHGTSCAQHVSLSGDPWFFEQSFLVDGQPVSLHDAWMDWLDGGRVVHVDDPVVPTSVCP
jgi:hypothetical protein